MLHALCNIILISSISFSWSNKARFTESDGGWLNKFKTAANVLSALAPAPQPPAAPAVPQPPVAPMAPPRGASVVPQAIPQGVPQPPPLPAQSKPAPPQYQAPVQPQQQIAPQGQPQAAAPQSKFDKLKAGFKSGLGKAANLINSMAGQGQPCPCACPCAASQQGTAPQTGQAPQAPVAPMAPPQGASPSVGDMAQKALGVFSKIGGMFGGGKKKSKAGIDYYDELYLGDGGYEYYYQDEIDEIYYEYEQLLRRERAYDRLIRALDEE